MVEVTASGLIGTAAVRTEALDKFVRILATGRHLTIIDADDVMPGHTSPTSTPSPNTSTQTPPT